MIPPLLSSGPYTIIVWNGISVCVRKCVLLRRGRVVLTWVDGGGWIIRVCMCTAWWGKRTRGPATRPCAAGDDVGRWASGSGHAFRGRGVRARCSSRLITARCVLVARRSTRATAVCRRASCQTRTPCRHYITAIVRARRHCSR